MQTASQVTMDMLWVRTSDEGLAQIGIEPFCYYQKAYEAKAGHRNIIWKARQMGFTTYSLAKAFLAACNGKTAIAVMNSPSAAEHAFEIIKMFIKHLPEPLPIERLSDKDFSLGLGNSPVRYQLQIFNSLQHGIACGQMIDFAHFSEFAWWSQPQQRRNIESIMPTLRPDSEFVIESTPDERNSGMFREIWDGAESNGFVRHFFPWWTDVRRVADAVNPDTLSKGEKALIEGQHLSLEQIGWRRNKLEDFNGPETMFKVEFGEAEV